MSIHDGFLNQARSLALPLIITSLVGATTLHAEKVHQPGQPVDGDFKTFASDFIQYHCFDCHGDGMEKGGLSLENLGPVDETNAALWKAIWAQVSIHEMPPKKEEQPTAMERIQFTDWIIHELETVMKDKGGFHAHKEPKKGNFVNHDLLFGDLPEGLKLVPTSSPKRIWRITPDEHITRLNELINTEPAFDPKNRGLRTHGDAVPVNHGGELKLYFGIDRINSWAGGTVAYATSIKSVPVVLSAAHKHGFENYAHMSSVNSSESVQILSKANDILKYMAYGPESLIVHPEQITDDPVQYDLKVKGSDLRGTPMGVTYNTKVIRPLTPLYELLREPKAEYSDGEILGVIEYLFEMLTFRPPSNKEAHGYLDIVKNSITKVGKENGLFMGLSAIFLDRDALFYPELAAAGEPDSNGRTMLQDWELGLAVNRAVSYLKPDPQLRQAIVDGRMRTREDVRREITRMLADDSMRKPRVLQFFREYFDYDLAGYVCKDEAALQKTGVKANAQAFRKNMLMQTASTDRLVELILEKDEDVLRNLLTTQQIVVAPRNQSFYKTQKEGADKKRKRKTADLEPDTPALEERAEIKEQLKNDDLKREKRLELYRKFNKKKYGHADGYHSEEEALKERKWTERGAEHINARVGYRSFEKGSLTSERLLEAAPKGQRLGILTQPSWLVSHSDAMDNHAIHRGIWIRTRLLGGGIPDVPITVDAQLPDEPNTPLRERMRVTRKEYCWSCHEKMDPLGLPFEMYNHAGLFRKTELGEPVDTSGEIIASGDPALDGPVTDAHDLISKLVSSERVEQVFVRHAFRFWMGRNETLHDGPVLKAAHKAYRDSGGSMKALITSLVTSDAFLYRK
ncbi:hypothetical protein NT6N_33710 [Oceaniferula spumae]|uniref:DUF1588 domain-containing protein n=1 Tax=Oceaniferula spumae TaxID=2979115 RepID=A0AAT9FQQ5_9BACT